MQSHTYSSLEGQCKAKTAFHSQQGRTQLARVSSNTVHSGKKHFSKIFPYKKGTTSAPLHSMYSLSSDIKNFHHTKKTHSYTGMCINWLALCSYDIDLRIMTVLTTDNGITAAQVCSLVLQGSMIKHAYWDSTILSHLSCLSCFSYSHVLSDLSFSSNTKSAGIH